MRLTDKTLGFVINFLLGVAWAFVLIGAVSSFYSFYQTSIFFAIVSALIGALPGLAAILVLEHIITGKEKLAELRKQTKLLEEISKKEDAIHYVS
ncbi:hypothetical protein YH65_07250 [Sulfurovum lithotrophicum]|uniref:Integral membrane protein n=1 Tax=Sulfurovum lithotrophicum TaxID=206403 RepID=A0A7U4RQT2_9BACT|nr:hypothetical protein [Sulfurovum lithotrophicum]AKF25213.1 hypothetical protein YH65_07250 [Sulfurovum lithotrophicum]